MVALQLASLSTRSLSRFLSLALPLYSSSISSLAPSVLASHSQSSSTAPPYSLTDPLLDGNGSDIHPPARRFTFPKKGQELELVCESLAFKGMGVCKVVDTGFVVFCSRALPGERLIARITKKKGSYAEAIKLKTLVPHDNAMTPPCVYAIDCGGCKLQNLSYDAQLAAKEEQVYESISRIGRFQSGYDSFMKEIVGCESQFHYRNKMEFSFGTRIWIPQDGFESGSQDVGINQFALGLHAPGRFDKILSINKCLLQEHAANVVLEEVQKYCGNHVAELQPYDTNTHTGFLKHLMLRSGREPETGNLQLMVNFVTSTFEPQLLQPLVNELVKIVPEVVSVVNNINSRVGNTSVGEQEHVLYGSSTITEIINGLVFEISANSFFQTNPRQAEILYRLVEEAAMLQGNGEEVVLDLFCGTGTIGLTLARRAKHVYGYEMVPEAVADAWRNALRNNIHNTTFIQGDLNKIRKDFGDQFPLPDVVITDPNRPGMHIDLIKFLLKLRAKRIIYVSCNPATCARDLDYLSHGLPGTGLEGVYQLKSVQPVDMFPHTPHIECVCSLELMC